MPENWSNYKFPDPTLCPPYLPYVGLCKAINERWRATGEDEDLVEIPDKFSKRYGSPLYNLQSIDGSLKMLVDKFVRPENYSDLGVNSSLSDMLWTWEDLLLAGADGVEADVIDSTANPHPRLIPNWSAKWAKQRYKMLNLLRYVVVGAEYTYWEGDSIWCPTRYDAYQNALSNGTVREPETGGPSSWITGSFNGGEYGLVMGKLIRFKPVLPAGGSALSAWAISFIVPPSLVEDPYFDPMGSGLVQGWHKWTAVNGAFIDDPTPPPYPSAWDSYTGDSFYAGWEGKSFDASGNNALCYADFNPVFNFKA